MQIRLEREIECYDLCFVPPTEDEFLSVCLCFSVSLVASGDPVSGAWIYSANAKNLIRTCHGTLWTETKPENGSCLLEEFSNDEVVSLVKEEIWAE